jgi:hypothetical protein
MENEVQIVAIWEGDASGLFIEVVQFCVGKKEGKPASGYIVLSGYKRLL